MRLLLTTDTVGGVFSHAMELARGLAARRVDVALAARGRTMTRDQREEALRVPRLQVFEGPFRLEWMDEPWEDVARASEWLLDVDGKVHPDVVHLNEFAHGALPFGAPRLVAGHSCVCSWFEAVRGGPPPPSFDRYRLAVRRGLAGADLVVAPSRAMLDALDRHHGPLRRVAVVPNGRDPADFPPGPKEPRVLCAARLWDEAKDAAALDRVAPHLPWPVFLAGEEVHPDRAAEGRPPRRGAVPLGRLPPRRLAREYARSAIYCLPAKYEPFGLSVLEAALAGCALVLGDVASLRENWDGAARFVPPGDDGALRDALRDLCEDDAARRRLARDSRERARGLGAAAMADAYLQLYATLARRPRAATPEGAPCAS